VLSFCLIANLRLCLMLSRVSHSEPTTNIPWTRMPALRKTLTPLVISEMSVFLLNASSVPGSEDSIPT